MTVKEASELLSQLYPLVSYDCQDAITLCKNRIAEIQNRVYCKDCIWCERGTCLGHTNKFKVEPYDFCNKGKRDE